MLIRIFHLVTFLSFSAPSPAHVQSTLAIKCIDNTAKDKTITDKTFFIPRGKDACAHVDSFSDPEIDKKQIHADQVVFSQWIPLPKAGVQLNMSRWFQHIISVLQVDIKHSTKQRMG